MKRAGNVVIDIRDCAIDPQPAEKGSAIPQLDRFVRSRGRAGRGDSPPGNSIVQKDLGLNRRVAA
jgi:hypothetical protein